VKQARQAAGYLTIGASRGARGQFKGAAKLSFTFCPPDKRRRDRDNLIASMKAATDGIADALGIDDANFTATYSFGEPIKGGSVLVTISEAK